MSLNWNLVGFSVILPRELVLDLARPGSHVHPGVISGYNPIQIRDRERRKIVPKDVFQEKGKWVSDKQNNQCPLQAAPMSGAG